jgi:hypothetical protein
MHPVDFSSPAGFSDNETISSWKYNIKPWYFIVHTSSNSVIQSLLEQLTIQMVRKFPSRCEVFVAVKIQVVVF